MSKSARLFDLMQILRRHRRPVTGAELAREAGVSERTIYRYMAALQGLGAEIDAEPGIGYVLKPGFLLPPLMFTADEIQALALGAQWVSRQTDQGLARAAHDALAKIGAVLPSNLRDEIHEDEFHVGRRAPAHGEVDLPAIRQAMRAQRKLRVSYVDQYGQATDRVIWPIVIGFVENQRFVAGWCELRRDFRLFRLDRMASASQLQECYPGRRRDLVRRWRQSKQDRGSSGAH